MQPEARASILLLQFVVEGAARAGVQPARILAAAGVAGAALEDAEARVPYAAIQRAWQEAVRCTGDAAFALTLARAAAPGAFRVLDYLGRSSPTLREAFRQLGRCYRLLHDTVTVQLLEEAGGARLVYGGVPGQVPPQAAELALALAVLRGRALTGVEWRPEQVHFRHAAPADTAAYARLFGGPVHFAQPQHALLLEPHVLALPLTTADPVLHAILERHVEESLARLPRVDDFLQQVRRHVADGLRAGEPTLGSFAARAGLTPRTVQRRLGAQGTTYQAVVELVREELATRYLRERQLDIAEVAFLLGYSEPSAFHRAFKRWTGLTPQAFRAASARP